MPHLQFQHQAGVHSQGAPQIRLQVLFCTNYGSLQTKNPYWLDEAYASPVASADTSILERNLYLARTLHGCCRWYSSFCSIAVAGFSMRPGGTAFSPGLMRDVGFDFYRMDKHCPDLTARGFEASVGPGGPYTAVTAFEVLEHLTDPVAFLAELLESTGTDTIIFTTELFAGEPPAPEAWWYCCFATGQHISFHQRSTPELIGKRLGMHFHGSGMLHIWPRAKLNPLAWRMLTSPYVASLLYGLPRLALGTRTFADCERLLRADGG